MLNPNHRMKNPSGESGAIQESFPTFNTSPVSGVRVFPLHPPLFIRELTCLGFLKLSIFSHSTRKFLASRGGWGRRRRREKSNTVAVDVLVLKWFGGHENTSTRVNRNFPINQFCNFVDNRKISSENSTDANFNFDHFISTSHNENFAEL